MSHIRHDSSSIVITVETSNPSNFHSLLLRGVNDAIQYYIGNPDKKQDVEGLIALLHLQQALLPDESELKKAFE